MVVVVVVVVVVVWGSAPHNSPHAGCNLISRGGPDTHPAPLCPALSATRGHAVLQGARACGAARPRVAALTAPPWPCGSVWCLCMA